MNPDKDGFMNFREVRTDFIVEDFDKYMALASYMIELIEQSEAGVLPVLVFEPER